MNSPECGNETSWGANGFRWMKMQRFRSKIWMYSPKLYQLARVVTQFQQVDLIPNNKPLSHSLERKQHNIVVIFFQFTFFSDRHDRLMIDIFKNNKISKLDKSVNMSSTAREPLCIHT